MITPVFNSRIFAIATVLGLAITGTGCVTMEGGDGKRYTLGPEGWEERETAERAEGETQDEAGTDAGGTQEPSEDITFSLTTNRDIDTAYARIRREFDFPTLDERAPEGHRQREWIKLDAGFHHRTEPGVTYSMRNREEHDGHNGIMQVDIDREGSGAYVEVLYHARDGDEHAFPTSEDFKNSLRERVQNALR